MLDYKMVGVSVEMIMTSMVKCQIMSVTLNVQEIAMTCAAEI